MPSKKAEKASGLVQSVKIVAVPKMMMVLAAVFLGTWILIGLFILVFIVQGQRRGAFSGLTGAGSAAQTQTQQVPTETEIPGIGKVNIACVQSALSPESIQKLLSAGNISALASEEKTRFEACLVK